MATLCLSTSNILQNSLRGMLDLDYSTNFRSRLHCFFFHSGTRTVRFGCSFPPYFIQVCRESNFVISSRRLFKSAWTCYRGHIS